MSAVTESGVEVECGETAAYCICVKPAGHAAAGDPVHTCDQSTCTAEWTGHYDDGSPDGGLAWFPVTLPYPVPS